MKVNFSMPILKRARLKPLFLGQKDRKGLVEIISYYIVLFGIGFLFLYPVLYMIINSFMSPEDVVDPAITWLPTSVYFGNFIKAFKTLNFKISFINSMLMSAVPALLQTVASALIGYGLARFSFPFKRLWMVLLLVTFIIPAQVTMIPRYIMFHNYRMINTPFTSFLPAAFGQGIKGAIFILIFFQFFSSYPKSLDEAAEIDGAGRFKIFYRIAVPMAKPAIVVSILFSFVWYWNETVQAGLFFGSAIKTLPMKLGSFADTYKNLFTSGSTSNLNMTVNALNESISLAGTFLSILPLLILYLVLQKQFVESVEKSGITGE